MQTARLPAPQAAAGARFGSSVGFGAGASQYLLLGGAPTVFATRLASMPDPTPEVAIEMWAFPMDRESGTDGCGSGGMLVTMDGFAPGAGGTLVCFGCEDCAVQAASAAAPCGSAVQEKMAIGEHGSARWCATPKAT